MLPAESLKILKNEQNICLFQRCKYRIAQNELADMVPASKLGHFGNGGFNTPCRNNISYGFCLQKFADIDL